MCILSGISFSALIRLNLTNPDVLSNPDLRKLVSCGMFPRLPCVFETSRLLVQVG